jgi:hypothetical protein
MSDFIANGAADLPPVKSDLRVPTGAASEWTAEDANDLRQALLDLRSYLLGPTGGTRPTVSGDPAANAALISIILALEALGFVTNRTLNHAQYLTDGALASDSFRISKA